MMKRRRLVASLVPSLAAVLMLAAGCGEPSPTAAHMEPTAAAAARAVGEVGGKVTPLKARYRAGRFSRTIGPDGGVLPFGIGTLIVPRGALSETIEITASVNGEDLAVEFEPHGLQFRPGYEPTLALHYGLEDQEPLQLFYFDESGLVLDALNTSLDLKDRTATSRLHHFSAYGLAASL